ncbi:hypothetical protein AbraIFM66951_007878 [Aspergillus brasiliensis]|uniref:L-tryptophan decarboxylase PsiD-like domain-containing protein n=1 Tax=Aspergillus brasiliensis TaxID=319629 RepID=A0A9W5Z0Z0_9EURO|nr:hypothetical protein AbraCBS73388_002539 [Aspergillus brasiliensis]GKZ45275.1 hypothetical protein AbraIFM66951_007878 [Aspergillus brasiliensis]
MDFIKNVASQVTSTDLNSSIKAFKSLIEGDPQLFKLSTDMFTQTHPGNPTIPSNLATFIIQLNSLVRSAPAFSTQRWASSPLTKFIEPYIRTPSGYEFFLNSKVNSAFHDILKEWGKFLRTPASAAVLTGAPNGWFSPDALSNMPDFEKTFQCDPSKPHWGFTSWEDFFNRKLREGARPIAEPDNPGVVTAAVDGVTYKLATDIKAKDEFWVKDQPYSLQDMFAGDPIAEKFVGGTILQVYLEPTGYHRWHAPVAGIVTRTLEIPGVFCPAQRDNTSLNDWVSESQGYAVHTATRHLIFIETENKALVCCLFAGILERGSCETSVLPGDRVEKGQELGMFHYGGSTHCLIFRPETKVEWSEAQFVKMGEEISRISLDQYGGVSE